MSKPITKQLLEKYYAGQCDINEKKQVEQWLRSGEYNQPLDLDEAHKDQVSKAMWQNIASDMRPDAQKAVPLYRKALPYAAAVALLMVLGISSYFLSNSIKSTTEAEWAAYRTVETKRGQKRTVTLPDGSTIRMNYETEVRVPAKFEGDQRVVYLTGHAHFDVARDEARPFIIYTEDTKTEVLGTSFDINTKDDGATEIIVTSGKVAFSKKNKEDHQVTLSVNSRALLNTNDKIETSEVDARKLTAWKDNRLVFEFQTLSEIIEVLEPWYDVSITVKKKDLLDMDYKFSADNPSLKSLLEQMSFMGKFKYTIEGKQITIF
ncbi:MAG: FecR domain-containing protein [Bacteroidota bacterium]